MTERTLDQLCPVRKSMHLSSLLPPNKRRTDFMDVTVNIKRVRNKLVLIRRRKQNMNMGAEKVRASLQ